MPLRRSRVHNEKGETVFKRLIFAGLGLFACFAEAALAAPVVSLTSPTADMKFVPPASITLTASASDSSKKIHQVDFYYGTTLIGSAKKSPYSVTWSQVPAGSYVLTAKATNNKKESATSQAVNITVASSANASPAVSLTSPAAGSSYSAPASLTLTANASDSDGSIAKVEFFNGASVIGTATAAPYTVVWSKVAAGAYTLTAKATDNGGAVATSAPVTVTVLDNQPPTVSLTAAKSQAGAPVTVTFTATAADADGSIAKLEFYNGATLLGTATAAPYSYTWTDVPQGSYSLTAKATDDRGAATTSAAVAVDVAAGPAQAYYIYADHLNTPRQVVDKNTQVVWRWDQDDPFGANAPAASNGFALNLRFPGQYYDAETKLHYNYFRDYDPQTGRYVQSDPIGLAGGPNTYAYVGGNPASDIDPLGEAAAGARIGGMVGGAIAGTLGVETGPLDIAITMAGRAAGAAIGSKIEDMCTKDPCDELLRQIRDIAGKLRTKIRQQETDQYDLFRQAYAQNPGGAIDGKGTWIGHDAQITGLKKGLARKVEEAQAANCSIPPDVLQLLATPNPTRPNR
jgi:RHS repeat-associated protein